MRISTLNIVNFKSILQSGDLELGPIALFVGRNNAGKSAVLGAIHTLQTTGFGQPEVVRFGSNEATVSMSLLDIDLRHWNAGPGGGAGKSGKISVQVRRDTSHVHTLQLSGGGNHSMSAIPAVEPLYFLVPYLSSRRVTALNEAINSAVVDEVRSDLANLTAKVDRLMDPNHPRHGEFRDSVAEVIGLPLSAIASPNGKQVGIRVNESEWIRLEHMGDGVAQMLGLITQLCIARGKLFLIEELENDIHPEGLKALLRLIEERSSDNQFVITTHSNVVLRHLGAMAGSVVYEVTSKINTEGGNRLPTTDIARVGKDARERSRLLTSLGYEFSDFELFDGWLILEESSAERVIRDHLARWFAAGLSRVRTVAANGTGDIDRTFSALDKLVLFTHLQDRYMGRVLVLVDGDPTGHQAVAKLRDKYPNWSDSAFATLSRPEFELYYPTPFTERVNEVLAIEGSKQKRTAKRQLLLEVLAWIESNEDVAREAFKESAAEVIEHLQRLEAALLPVQQLPAD